MKIGFRFLDGLQTCMPADRQDDQPYLALGE